MLASSLKCFGVGDGWPSPDRHHSAFLYRLGQGTFLVDCGEPVSRSIKESGLNYDAIDRLFITHLHSDHIGGFFMLMQSFWLERRTKELFIHLPPDAIGPLQRMLEAVYLFEDLPAFRWQFQPIAPREPIEVNGVRATAFPTTHLEGLRRRFRTKFKQDFAAFSFLFETEARRAGHSGDVGRPEDLEPLVSGALDLLVCELAHFSPEDLFQYLEGRSIRKLVLIHLSREIWSRRDEIQAMAQRALPRVAICLARDGDDFDF